MAYQGAEMPWLELEGNWKAMDGGHDVPIIKADKLIERRGSKVTGTRRYGAFGEADPINLLESPQPCPSAPMSRSGYPVTKSAL